jgi:hypothetical protein
LGHKFREAEVYGHANTVAGHVISILSITGLVNGSASAFAGNGFGPSGTYVIISQPVAAFLTEAATLIFSPHLASMSVFFQQSSNGQYRVNNIGNLIFKFRVSHRRQLLPPYLSRQHG